MQWQSDIYPYGVKQSKWRGGKGDLVRDFVNSARKYGLLPGLYVAMHYNWFLGVRKSGGRVNAEGYYGTGPKQAKNIIRWVGNERGVAPYPCWATGRDVTQSDGVKESRGERFSGTPDGLIAENEMKIYAGFGRLIKGRYANKICATEGEGNSVELAIPKDKGPVNQVMLMERIERGERVREFTVEAQSANGGWREIYKGSCIGHKHIVRFDKIEASKLRLLVAKSAATPLIRDFSAYCN